MQIDFVNENGQKLKEVINFNFFSKGDIENLIDHMNEFLNVRIYLYEFAMTTIRSLVQVSNFDKRSAEPVSRVGLPVENSVRVPAFEAEPFS